MKKNILLTICLLFLVNITKLLAVTYSVSSIPYSPYPYTGGTTLTLGDDATATGIPIGFPFQFFNETHTTVGINSNAVIAFNTIPSLRLSPGTAYKEIYANMHDMFPGLSGHPGNINYYTVGTSPDRVFVVNYYDIVRFGSPCFTHNYTGQVVLHEGSNNIDIYLQQKDSCSTSVPSSTIGIADTGGTHVYAPGRTYSPWYAENEGWRFCYNSVCATGGVAYSFVKGRVYYDANSSCTKDLGEIGLPSNNIELYDSISGAYRYASSDVAGNYTAILSAGDWRVRLIPSAYILPSPCPDQYISIDSTADSGVIDLPGTIRSCPYLSTSVSTFLIRPCSTAVHTVNYFNGGTTSPVTWVDVTLDTTLTYDSATAPLISVTGNIYRFNIGSVPFLTGGSFRVYSRAHCWLVIRQTVCVESHIYPDSICPPPPSGWDQSNLEASTYEDTIGTDSVVLKIKNIGSGNMSGPTILNVVEDIIMIIHRTDLLLNAGQELVVRLPSNGKMYRIDATQTASNPYKTYTAAAIEGATESSADTISYGLVNNFPLDDEPVFIDMTCDEVRSSFDPNAKSSTPEGLGASRLVEKNTTIQYRIEFQNKGNDTAFYVAIEDSISPLLQIGSIAITGSSHPVTRTIMTNNHIKFEFNNIRLQDSASNEPASHGYLDFTIDQQPNLLDGSVIYNKAGITFDVNNPVITNTTFLTLGRLMATGFVSYNEEKFDVLTYPNPFQTEIHISSTQIDNQSSIKIYSIDGHCVYESKGGNNEFVIQRKDLMAGMYIYKIFRNNKAMGTGKLVAQ